MDHPMLLLAIIEKKVKLLNTSNNMGKNPMVTV